MRCQVGVYVVTGLYCQRTSLPLLAERIAAVHWGALAGATSGVRSLPGSFSSASTQAAPSTTASSQTHSSNSSSSRGGAGVASLAGSVEAAGGPVGSGSGVQQAAATSSNAGLLQSLDEETVR